MQLRLEYGTSHIQGGGALLSGFAPAASAAAGPQARPAGGPRPRRKMNSRYPLRPAI